MKTIGSPIPKEIQDRLDEYDDIMDVAVKNAIDENQRLGLSSEESESTSKSEADAASTGTKPSS